MKLFRVFAGVPGSEQLIAEFPVPEGCNAYYEVIEHDAEGKTLSGHQIPMVVGYGRIVVVMPHNATIQWREN